MIPDGFQEGDQANLIFDFSDPTKGIHLSRGRRVTVAEVYPSGRTLRVEWFSGDASFGGSTLIDVSFLKKAESKLFHREFIGGPMDGHFQLLEEAREAYIYGDENGLKKGMYLLDTDDGKMYHVKD